MRTALLMLALVLSCSAAAAAQQPVLSLADLGMSLKSGDTVFVTGGDGRDTRGTFATVTSSVLTFLVDGELRDIPSADIRQVARQGDSLKNGFLIGAGFGALFGAVKTLQCDELDVYCDPALIVFPGSVLAYGGIGALIDHFIRGRTVVFRNAGTGLQLRPGVSVWQRGMSASIVMSAR